MRKQKRNVKTRNVVVKIGTYSRLEKYKVELVKKMDDPKITYDDVINDLLDTVAKMHLERTSERRGNV